MTRKKTESGAPVESATKSPRIALKRMKKTLQHLRDLFRKDEDTQGNWTHARVHFTLIEEKLEKLEGLIKKKGK